VRWRRAALVALRSPHPFARLRIAQDLRAFIRVHFLFSAQHTGLMTALSEPARKEDLIKRLGIERQDLFQLLLDLGVSLGELDKAGERYRLKGGRSRALSGGDQEVLAALLDEFVLYHASVYRHLPERLRGAPLGDYLQETAAIVARSSRIVEPFIRDYIRELVTPLPAPHILDVGCGSGVYLQATAEARPDATGAGIDMQEAAVHLAQRNLEHWGLAAQFTVNQADIRAGTAYLGGPFDLILLINNIYYFSPEERPMLFRELRSTLTERGTLVVISMFHGTNPTTLDLDLVLGSTLGCHPLPHLDSAVSQLLQSGFLDARSEGLIPGQPFFAIQAR
jgi:4-hydroxy-2,2'-bipyrrole-5-carbaldehyde O-methyltransferase